MEKLGHAAVSQISQEIIIRELDKVHFPHTKTLF